MKFVTLENTTAKDFVNNSIESCRLAESLGILNITGVQ